ncbi:hypothetical protein F383_35042 [Gossypium arboreum]|uniref:Uncharacterized protein n=1 Tax=Gossypium arboreum TaxID=29729 RepID=A0A0B0PUT3_GOSAR|nr:hypothetical protein F383_35042 [Gossypium arboreum]
MVLLAHINQNSMS